MLFDNGDNRNWGEAPSYSRAVEYRIDDNARTIQQVWTFGKEQANHLYSRVVSNVDYYPIERRLIFSAGSVNDDGVPVGRVVELDYDSKAVIFEATVIPEVAPFGVTFHRTERLRLYTDPIP